MFQFPGTASDHSYATRQSSPLFLDNTLSPHRRSSQSAAIYAFRMSTRPTCPLTHCARHISISLLVA
jgi:hypothetical protein